MRIQRNSAIEIIIGYLLLIPSVLSVFLFVYTVFFGGKYYSWFVADTGNVYYQELTDSSHSVSGSSSAFPFYAGILAFVGAYLIKNSKNSNDTNENN